MPKQKTHRAAVTKASGKPVLVWFDPAIILRVDQQAENQDLDRSKWIRRAVERHLRNPA